MVMVVMLVMVMVMVMVVMMVMLLINISRCKPTAQKTHTDISASSYLEKIIT